MGVTLSINPVKIFFASLFQNITKTLNLCINRDTFIPKSLFGMNNRFMIDILEFNAKLKDYGSIMILIKSQQYYQNLSIFLT